MIKPKRTKKNCTISTTLTEDEYNQLYQLVAGKTTISDAVRQIVLKFLSENTE